MVMRLIDGIFPDYMQVIPKEADRTLTVDRPRLLDTLRRMSILSSDRTTNAVKLELLKDTLKVTSQNPDLGDAKMQETGARTDRVGRSRRCGDCGISHVHDLLFRG